MSEQLTTRTLFARDEVRNKFQEMLGKRAPQFITSVLQVVSSNKLLQKADPASVYASAAVCATLDLPLNNSLGFAYIVPYNENVKVGDRWEKKAIAQFQMGYKGYIQLAQRSSLYKTINATDVREGELLEENRLTGESIFAWEKDREKRKTLPIIGYVSYFELNNGFSKSLYMSKGDVHDHAKQYSQTFKMDKGRWVEDFDAMALKTVLKLNISKFGPLSIEMQNAVIYDQGIVRKFNEEENTFEVDYVDNDNTAPSITNEDLKSLFEANTAILGDKLQADALRVINNKEEASYAKIKKAIEEEVKEANKG